MDSTCEYWTPTPDVSPDSGLLPHPDHALCAPRRRPQSKLSLIHELRIGIAGALLGVIIHVVYLFILVSLPFQTSGAAELGQRFSHLP